MFLVSLYGPQRVILDTAMWLKLLPDYLDILRHMLNLRSAGGEFLIQVNCDELCGKLDKSRQIGHWRHFEQNICCLLDLMERVDDDDPAVYATRIEAIRMMLDRGADITDHGGDFRCHKLFYYAMFDWNQAERFQMPLLRVVLNGDRMRRLSRDQRNLVFTWLAGSTRATALELLAELADRANGGWDVNFVYAFNNAIERDNALAIRVLCGKTDPNRTGTTTSQHLVYAIENRALESTRALLECGATPTAECVMTAIVLGETALGAELVGPRWKVAPDSGCLVALLQCQRDAASKSEAKKVQEVVAMLRVAAQWGGGQVVVDADVMEEAVRSASKAVMRVLIEHGGRVDAELLGQASLADRGVGFVKLLLDSNPELPRTTELLRGLPFHGYFLATSMEMPTLNAEECLRYAVRKDDFRMVLRLLRNGAHVSWEVLLVSAEALAMTAILLYHGAARDAIIRDAKSAGRLISHFVSGLDNCCNITSRYNSAYDKAYVWTKAKKTFKVGVRVARAVAKTLLEVSVSAENSFDLPLRISSVVAALTDFSPSLCKHRVAAFVQAMTAALPPGTMQSSFGNAGIMAQTNSDEYI
ncbi:hypothetical protein HK101_011667 [Irineochytrium annulatum]|nr:hypothetical protein HK101_011667 [Irineochytrium annulatum]